MPPPTNAASSRMIDRCEVRNGRRCAPSGRGRVIHAARPQTGARPRPAPAARISTDRRAPRRLHVARARSVCVITCTNSSWPTRRTARRGWTGAHRARGNSGARTCQAVGLRRGQGAARRWCGSPGRRADDLVDPCRKRLAQSVDMDVYRCPELQPWRQLPARRLRCAVVAVVHHEQRLPGNRQVARLDHLLGDHSVNRRADLHITEPTRACATACSAACTRACAIA